MKEDKDNFQSIFMVLMLILCSLFFIVVMTMNIYKEVRSLKNKTNMIYMAVEDNERRLMCIYDTLTEKDHNDSPP